MNTQTPPAPALPRRLAAIVYDTLLVVPLIMVCVAVGLGIRQLLGSAADSLLPATLVQIIAVFSCIGFFGTFWLKSGQTLGMQAWRIKLVPMPGNEMTFGRVVTRCVSALLSAVCLGLGYWWCLFDRRKRCWHDYLSGTELVLLPKVPKKSAKNPTTHKASDTEKI
ncbi:RDD family protein [Congregibacter variabilis]|uniref:RDD family protein n=1 Tax=Congregibacter variabilis TaxID=3081200 RepID=A0ABZ0I5X0_9GAMM|nr:RDD family protein [Congregibacter sp. IMCC43200]